MITTSTERPVNQAPSTKCRQGNRAGRRDQVIITTTGAANADEFTRFILPAADQRDAVHLGSLTGMSSQLNGNALTVVAFKLTNRRTVNQYLDDFIHHPIGTSERHLALGHHQFVAAASLGFVVDLAGHSAGRRIRFA